jgi:hypothetical protein
MSLKVDCIQFYKQLLISYMQWPNSLPILAFIFAKSLRHIPKVFYIKKIRFQLRPLLYGFLKSSINICN